MRIALLDRVFYPPETTPGPWRSEVTPTPTWDQVEAAVRAMHPWERPIVSLQRHAEVPDREVMNVCGGEDRFHLQISDVHGEWKEACDLNAATDPSSDGKAVCVWRSDQGFATTEDRLWNLDEAIQMIRHYCEADSLPPGPTWV